MKEIDTETLITSLNLLRDIEADIREDIKGLTGKINKLSLQLSSVVEKLNLQESIREDIKTALECLKREGGK